jgi:cholesterol transport system auxiliary component
MLRGAVFLLALSACALNNPAPPSAAFYDLLARPISRTAPSIDELLLVEPVAAPSWLDTNAIVYRLAYAHDAKHHAYANNHWVGPPSDLLTARLVARLADSTSVVQPGQGLRSDYALRVELLEFVQVFDSPHSSRGVVTLRASLINARSLVAQKGFSASTPASSPDASGAVQALSQSAEAVISEILEWVASTLDTDTRVKSEQKTGFGKRS